MSQSYESGDVENPYSPQEVVINIDEADDSETEDLRTFVGGNADYYLSKWIPLLAGRASGAGFNWAAFFLSGLWLPYRRMYKAAAILFGLIMLETIAEEVVFIEILKEPDIPGPVSAILGLLVGIVCGTYGNGWYLRHAQKVISEVGSEVLDPATRVRVISERGGTSFIASLGCFALFFTVMFGVFYALDFMRDVH